MRNENIGLQYDVEVVFNEYYPALCLFASKFLPQQGDAEDVVQEVFVNFIEKTPALKNDAHLQNHLYLSVRNSCLSHIRRAGVHNRYLGTLSDDQLQVFVDSEMLSAEVYRRLTKSLDLLPTECRKVFELSYIQGYDNETVASKLSLSINTVKAQKARGKKILREKLKDMFSLFVILYGIDNIL